MDGRTTIHAAAAAIYAVSVIEWSWRAMAEPRSARTPASGDIGARPVAGVVGAPQVPSLHTFGWIAFGVVVITGLLSVMELDQPSVSFLVAFALKMLVAVSSALAAAAAPTVVSPRVGRWLSVAAAACALGAVGLGIAL